MPSLICDLYALLHIPQTNYGAITYADAFDVSEPVTLI